ncbi:DUF2298 domain-containing protein [bacterium]|nr:DUF2298 domain-containing protein [bacterium]
MNLFQGIDPLTIPGYKSDVLKLNYLLGAVLFLSIVFISGIHGFLLQSLASLLLLTVLLVTGWGMSCYLFRDRHITLLFAFPVGYIVHSLLLALIARFYGFNRFVLIIYLILAITFLFLRRAELKKSVGSWKNSDFCLLMIWLLAAVAVTAWPLLHVGTRITEGYAFRAYFNADYFKHLGITGTLSQSGIPPLNPYLSGSTLHYYWFFYVLPAYWNKLFTTYPAEFMMIQFTFAGSLMFVASLFAVLRQLIRSQRVLGIMLTVFLFAGSYEGLYAIYHLRSKSLPIGHFSDLNIDAITRWFWRTPQIDTMFRALLYAPQHLLVLTVMLMALLHKKEETTLGSRLFLMGLIFSTLGFAAIIGAVFIAGSLLFLLLAFLKEPRAKAKELLLTGLVGALFLFVYFPFLHMFKLGAGEWSFGLVATVWQTLPQYLLLNWGALLFLGVSGILFSVRDFPVRFCVFYLLLSVLCMQFVQNRMGGSEVTLKLGYVCNVCLLLLTAGFLARYEKRFGIILAIVLPLILPASITLFMDVYNSQDVHNQRFTTVIPQEDAEVYGWMRENLQPQSVVQYYSISRETELVSPIPSFAHRMVYVGDKFHAKAFQVDEQEVARRENVVWALFHRNGTRAHSLARKEGIQYLFVSAAESSVSESRYQLVPPFFSTLFQNGKALLVKVNEIQSEVSMEDSEVMIRNERDEPVLKVTFIEHFYDSEPVRYEVGRWMSNEGLILVESTEEMSGEFQMNLKSLRRSRSTQIFWNDELAATVEVPVNAVAVSVPVKIAKGENKLLFRCPDGAEPVSESRKDLFSVQISSLRFVRK